MVVSLEGYNPSSGQSKERDTILPSNSDKYRNL